VLLGAGALWTFSTVYVLVERERSFAPALEHGDLAQAQSSLERLAAIRRASLLDYHRVASLAAQRNDSTASLRILDAALARHGDDPTTIQTKANYLEKLGRIDEAIAVYEAGGLLQPEDADLALGHGRLLLRRGDLDAAETALSRAKTLAPDDRRIDLLLERVQAKRAGRAEAPSGA
jgi:tetratricopeptide (TPR) repeat protein